ncbi:hypothetical protein DICA1_F37566 [Diutina catenulata]
MDFFGGGVIDIDLDTSGMFPRGNFPDWLSDILNRALNAGGDRRKQASQETIKALVPVQALHELDDVHCPICYDEYLDPVLHSERQARDREREQAQKDAQQLSKNRSLAADAAVHNANKGLPTERLSSRRRFADPALFFPVDEGGHNYLRFPQANLTSLEEVTDAEYFPGYTADSKRDPVTGSGPEPPVDEELHLPVLMPQCAHVFGRSCLVEWFKNNLSCPLCRKEIELPSHATAAPSPAQRRRQLLQEHGRFEFCTCRDDEIARLVATTNVFEPFRRPFSATITPLSDLFMRQAWATPGDRAAPASSHAPDPDLVFPQSMPMTENHRFFHID